MEQYKLLTVTHRTVPLTQLSQFFLSRNGDETARNQRLRVLRDVFDLEELVYLETCNRVVYFFTTRKKLDRDWQQEFLQFVNPDLLQNAETAEVSHQAVQVYQGSQAVRHLHEIAASLDSMIVGEREILRQLRQAYEHCSQLGLTGDDLRIAFKFAIPAAKRIYTETRIAERPISVVSLAARELKSSALAPGSRIALVGAGETMLQMAKFLRDFPFRKYVVFNRSLSNGEKLAAKLGGVALPLTELESYAEPVDVLITCTGSPEPLIKANFLQQTRRSAEHTPLVIDLAVPGDVHPEVLSPSSDKTVVSPTIRYIGMEHLRITAEGNIAFRREEMEKAQAMVKAFTAEFQRAWHIRQLERTFQHIPAEVRSIRQRAVNDVFAREIGRMDEDSRETLHKVLDYLERKFNALPISEARDAMEAHWKVEGPSRSPMRRVAR